MNEPRKPIFGFLWARPDPQAPVDGAYRQVRPVRISPRGPIRLVTLLVGAAGVAVTTGTVVLGAATTSLTPITVAAGALAATSLVLLLRGWVVGTYVTDDHLVIETTWRRTRLTWAQVARLDDETRRCPFLGIPLGVPARRIVVVDDSGAIHGTHVYSTSPDYWLRPEALDIAVLRLGRWHQDAS